MEGEVPTRATIVHACATRVVISMEALTVRTPPNNSMQPTALRAAADAERSPHNGGT